MDNAVTVGIKMANMKPVLSWDLNILLLSIFKSVSANKYSVVWKWYGVETIKTEIIKFMKLKEKLPWRKLCEKDRNCTKYG